jgi:hypothetical protein
MNQLSEAALYRAISEGKRRDEEYPLCLGGAIR